MPSMDYVKIWRRDLSPSRIGLGTWAIGGWMWGGTDPVGPEFMAPPARAVELAGARHVTA